ncbi:MAG: hypothetical protein NTU54_06490 [Candidatus Omnitrophica bacterium]|nr:hypothetical protein [Candidatus Omnitrophota bacterium]
MEKHLKRLPKEILDLIYLARDISTKEGVPAYLVGGCVRDLFLGTSHLDLDIVVEGDAISFADEFGRRLGVKVIHHRRFGTAAVPLAGHLKVDFATSRKEYYPHPADLPVVSPSSLKDDLFRRDFSINAMAINITARNFGKVVDLFGGKADLDKRIIRVMHVRSFIDDPTRILRAIRFEQRLGFRIEAHTLRYIKEAIKHHNIFAHIKPSRVVRELELILKEDRAIDCLLRLNQLCGLKVDEWIAKRSQHVKTR